VVQHGDGGVGVDAPVHGDGQGLAGVLIDHVEQLQDPPVGGLVELVVQRPHMVRVLGSQPVRWTRGGADPLAFAPLGRHAEAFLAPSPLHGLAVDRPALLQEPGVGRGDSPTSDMRG
jgi:hypothetical protein